MKKVFLFLAVFMFSVNAFARWEGTFLPSCGGSYYVILYGNTQADYVAALQQVNHEICGNGNVSIIFY